VLNSAIRVTRSENGAVSTRTADGAQLGEGAALLDDAVDGGAVGVDAYGRGLQMERNLEKAQRSLMMQ